MRKPDSYTLGLDLGPSSIGWAVVDDDGQQIIDAGVRVFPEGVERDKQGGELSKNEQRRIARGMRRQTARRARRKRRLRQALIKVGLLPEVASLPNNDERRIEWEREQFRQEDPYALRGRALEDRLEPYEIGRVLMHLNQRRGFLSNRKTDRAKKKEYSEILAAIDTLESELGKRTLGRYLDDLQADDSQARLRGRHTRRDMYEREFDAIWVAQQRHRPALLTEHLKYGSAGRQTYPCKPGKANATERLERYGLHGLIFFQRPMYWPKSVVGLCELEPKQRRCPRADRLAQRCRLLQEVNNLRLLDTSSAEERPLRPEERELLLRYLERSKERSFEDIRKEFCRKLSLPETIRFNLERGERKKMQGMPTDAFLAKKDFFGPQWHDRPEEEKDRIVRSLLEDEEAIVLDLATTVWGLSQQSAEKLLDVDLPAGYASFSRVALEKLRPHLERGLPLMTRDSTPSALSEAGYLRPDQREVNQKDYLPKPPPITNPLVRQALYEVRRLINAVIREYGKPAHIHIELAREVKGTALDRKRRTMEMRDRERTRDEAADAIRNSGVKVTRDAIDRYLLWNEQRRECIYSGRAISQAQLFDGEIDVDHILPRGRSLDNSLMNRVVCFRAENADKRDRTPHEWLAATNPDKYEAVLQRTKCLPYPKAQRFRQANVELDDFFARQFVDTTYITTQVHQYVRCLGVEDLLCSKGMHTADLRHHWGLNTVLRADERDQKNRDDHRHHAIDAIVIALTSRSRLQHLAGLYKRGRQEGEVLPEPWPHFRDAVEKAVNAINVSHRINRKVHGALHEETIYGPTQKSWRQREGDRPWAKDWIEQPGQFVHRKPLESLTLAEVEHIRDERVRELVIERLQRYGITAGRKKRGKSDEEESASGKGIPKEVWKEPLLLTPRKGASAARPAVIKTVRLVKKEGTIQPIRGGSAYVKPGSIHHLCIFEFTDERGKRKREAIFVSMLEAAQRKKNRQSIVQRIHPNRPEARFIMSLSRGEMVLGTFKGKEQLVRLKSSVSTERKMSFVPHTEARPSKDVTKYSVNANTLKGRKVTVDVLGRLRWASD